MKLEGHVAVPAGGEGGVVDLGEGALQPLLDTEGFSVRPLASADDFIRRSPAETVDCPVLDVSLRGRIDAGGGAAGS